MRIADSSVVQWHTGPGHREGGIRMRDLLMGEPGPNNYWLVLTRVESAYDAPEHAHAFDQVRIMLEGTFNFGPQDQAEGTIGYFCEGTPYTQQARGHSTLLLLQCEGASGTRFINVPELYRGAHELREGGGRFEAGLYIAPDGRKVDSYEAIWEHVTGQPVPHPQPRFASPVIMNPAHFDYRPLAGHPGVLEKRLGTFNERQLGIAYWLLEPDAERRWVGGDEGRTLFFVLRGDGEVASGEEAARPLRQHFAIEGAPEDVLRFAGGAEPLEILTLRLPSEP